MDKVIYRANQMKACGQSYISNSQSCSLLLCSMKNSVHKLSGTNTMACFWFLSYQTLLRYFMSHCITNAPMHVDMAIFVDILRGDYCSEYLPSPTL